MSTRTGRDATLGLQRAAGAGGLEGSGVLERRLRVRRLVCVGDIQRRRRAKVCRGARVASVYAAASVPTSAAVVRRGVAFDVRRKGHV